MVVSSEYGLLYPTFPEKRKPTAKPKPTQSISFASQVDQSSSNQSGNVPQALVGGVIESLIGRKRIPNANAIWFSAARPVATTTMTQNVDKNVEIVDGVEVEKVTTTNVYTYKIVGYTYDCHFAICLGPDVHLRAVYVDNRRVWQGDAGPIRSTITLDASETAFDSCICHFSGGNFDQTVEPLVTANDYPSYGGIACVFIQNMRADKPLGNISFEVERIPNPLALEADVNVTADGDVNLMTLATEVMTNQWGYGGLRLDEIDTAKYTSLAIKLANEKNFASLKLSDNSGVPAVLKLAENQGDMIFFEDHNRGKVSAALFREDYSSFTDVSAILSGRSNLLEISGYSKTGWQDTVDLAVGRFVGRDADYNPVSITAHSTANVSRNGRGRRTITFEYPMVATRELAQALTFRDLAYLSVPRVSFNAVVNRDGALRELGDLVFVSSEKNGIVSLPMHVIQIRKQPLNSGEVSLVLRQAELPDTGITFKDASDNYPTFEPDITGSLTPIKPTGAVVFEQPYIEGLSGNGQPGNNVPARYGYHVIAANERQAYIWSRYGYAGSDIRTQPYTNIYPNTAKLQTAVGKYDGFETGEAGNIFVDNLTFDERLLDIISGPGGDVMPFILFVNGEIMQFQNATFMGAGVWRLENVKRALFDTIFENHAVGSDVYFSVSWPASNIVGAGDANLVVDVYSITTTVSPDCLTFSLPKQSESTGRADKPIRPTMVSINGDRSSSEKPIEIATVLNVKFKPRSRRQSRRNFPLLFDAVTLGVETQTQWLNSSTRRIYHQRHRVKLRDSAGTVHLLGEYPPAGNYSDYGFSDMNMPTFPNPLDEIDVVLPAETALGVGVLWVEAVLRFSEGDRVSINNDELPVYVIPANTRVTSDGSVRVTSTGDIRVTS